MTNEKMSKLVTRMASFKGRLAVLQYKETKRAISAQEKTKMDITRPPGHGYLSEIRF